MALESASFDEGLLCLIKERQNNDEVKSIIEKKDLYNVTDNSKNTLLHMAARKNAEIARYLIDSGSRVDVQNERGRTPLMLAIEAVCEETVEVLLEAGANIELQDNLGKSALQIIGDGDCVSEKVLRLLLPKLQIVCCNNKEEVAKKLIDAHWPLLYVVYLKDSDLTKITLQRGYAAKIDALDGFFQTALHLAVESVDVENVKVLLEYNAYVNVLDDNARTPLSNMYEGGADRPNDRLDILKMLLDRGATIDCDPDDDYDTYDIFKYANREAMMLLFQSDIDKSANFNRLTALEMLVENENIGSIEEIHGRKFDLNARNDCDETPLMLAASLVNTRAVEFLLNEGADIDAVDFRNFLAIFRAINFSSKYEQCVQLLLERGADVQCGIVPSLQDEVRHQDISTILDSILNSKLFSLGELVVAHLALQEILGTSITKAIHTQINSCDRFKTHFDSSKQQLSMEVYESTTLLDLLTVSTDEKFESYARNDEFVLKVQDAVSALSDHRYFRTILQRHLSKAMTIATLKTGAARIISNIMGMSYDRIPLIADNIISFLAHEDMKNLIHASL